MDPMIIKTLPVFHAFTGCDTVSALILEEEEKWQLETHGKCFLMQAKRLKISF